MKVKICGITNALDAEEAVGLGAWAIGLIHHKQSPRSVRAAEAAEIGAAFRRDCEIVGVFVNPTLERVVGAVENAQLSMVQLSGEEGASFCAEVARRTGVKVIKAVHVSSAADIHAAEVYRTDFHLFDAAVSPSRQEAAGRSTTAVSDGRGPRGGTGRTFDWDLLAGHHSAVPTILAGGLTPENVTEAIRITRPDAVDVASGVESEPGLKDHYRLARFFEAARYTPVSAGAPPPAGPGAPA
jgi:phosphoribosylanthranilate isomerase